MYCENCGSVLAGQARFCAVCGTARFSSPSIAENSAQPVPSPRGEPKTTYCRIPRWVPIGLGTAFAALIVFVIAWSAIDSWRETERMKDPAYRAARLKRAEERDEERLAMSRLAQQRPELERRLLCKEAQRALSNELERNFGMPGYQTSWYGQILRVDVVDKTAIAKTRLSHRNAQASSICSAVSGFIFSRDNRRFELENVRVDGTDGVLIHRIGIASRCQ